MTSIEAIRINLNGVDKHPPELPIKTTDGPNREPIAIVGMGMRLPDAIHSDDQLWDLLIQKRTTRSEVPASRFNLAGFHSENGEAGTMPVHEGHFLAKTDPLDAFDISFFSMGKKEAEALDPQQKLLLEVVYECMTNAGQVDWRGQNIGCFVGVWGDVSVKQSCSGYF
jgi:acyl transferase domain-containing protein